MQSPASYRADASSGVWNVLAECVRAAGTTSCVVDASPPAQARRFYRVVRAGCPP